MVFMLGMHENGKMEQTFMNQFSLGKLHTNTDLHVHLETFC